MNFDISERSLVEQIKFMANIRKCSIKNLGEKFNQCCGTNYSPQSFSRKLGKGNFNFDEMHQLEKILGFKVKFELIDKTEEG